MASSVIRLSADAARNLTGLTGGSDGRIAELINVGAFAVTLKNQDILSSAANRFLLAADVVLAADESIALIYDSTSSRWRALTTLRTASAADIQTLLDGISTSQGVLLYYNGTDWVALSPGTTGQGLITNGIMGNPAWSDLAGDVTGILTAAVVAKINGAVLGSTTATDKNILIADGALWATRAVSGDVTISNTGTVTITNDAVSYAKMQNVSATDKLLGRSTAGAGDVEEIACTAAGRALLDDAAASNQRTTLGVGTGDSPEFTAVNIGHASDTTLARVSAGVLSVEGKTLVNLSDGGTFAADISVPDEVYGAGWDASVEVPTKNALYDKIQTLGSGIVETVLSPKATIISAGSNAITLDINQAKSGLKSIDNLSLTVSAAAGALTIAVKTDSTGDASATDEIPIAFRSPTATVSTLIHRTITAAMSMNLSSGSTLGATSGTPVRVWIVLFDDGGTIRLAAINCRSGKRIYPMRDYMLASATDEADIGGADSAGVFYAEDAISAKAIRVVGYLEWTSLATAGTWVAPDKIQIYGPGIPLPGDTIQISVLEDGAVATGTTTVPVDDTIPQQSPPEGDQYMTVGITPSAPGNVIEVTAMSVLVHSVASTWMNRAIYIDAVANALAATVELLATAGGGRALSVTARHITTGVAAVAFDFRAGGNNAGTTAFNGTTAGVRTMGGVEDSHMVAREIMG